VTDTVTGLVWERQVSAAPLDWEGAKQYCACLELDGNGDWRLPTRIELASLVDWASAAPSIDALAFPATPTENFWTSSLVETSPGLVYLVYFDNGHTTYSESDFEYRTRCVRSTPAPATERYELAAGSVRDTQTQLTWQQPAPKDELTWADAAAYCDALELDGSGWRLPSIGELQTLVDETRNPAVDAAAFPQTPSEYFWASSTVFGEPTRAWTTFFTNGSTYPFAQTALKNLRCVR
jgi:formylglycine-generating enzyme required for sulfatase activity